MLLLPSRVYEVYSCLELTQTQIQPPNYWITLALASMEAGDEEQLNYWIEPP